MTSANIATLTLTQPDDWHIHLRDDDALPRTVNDAARQFARVLVMPNLVPPVTEASQAAAYRDRIMQSLASNVTLEPLMVLYLTDNTDRKTVVDAKSSGFVQAFKWYPAGATTNSQSGVTNLTKIYPALETMQEQDLVLSVHGEVTDPQVDIFDREARFIEETLSKVVNDFPNLRIVLEHITTQQAVDFVNAAQSNVAATITAHHLLFNRNDMLVGGIRPHYFCLPILKREEHRKALVNAAVNGNPKYFLGTDSAPHTQHRKENACGCAGVYSAFSAIELYAQAFDDAKALDKLEAFAAFHGPDFYQLPRNQNKIELLRQPWELPQSLPMGTESLIPCQAGETLAWKLK